MTAATIPCPAVGRIAIASWLLFAPACSCDPPIAPAPEDIEGLSHWLWVNFLVADDAALADAVVKIHAATDLEHFSAPARSLLDDLNSDELEPVEMSDRDPAPAQGMLLVDRFDCTMEQLQAVFLDPDQGAIYPEIYQEYQRTVLTDLEAFKARTTNLVSFRNYYQAQPLPAARYEATTRCDLRYIGADPEVELPFGPMFIQRIWLPQPVHYFDTDANVFDLDFQVEIFYQTAPGKMGKFYPFWRHMAFNGVGASTDDEWIIDIVLDGQEDWDVRTAEVCAER
ncbi:MAG: hypothetical protein JXR83_13815 [Deltaproteobacteria bacterium]|nr:hypothetical protein [Deltaproteobacteria bacterium]